MNNEKLINEKSSNSKEEKINEIEEVKTDIDLSQYRLQILKDKSFDSLYSSKILELNTGNQINNNFTNIIGNMSQTLGIGMSAKNTLINGVVNQQSAMLVTTNKYMSNAHLFTTATGGYVMTGIPGAQQVVSLNMSQGVKVEVGEQLSQLASNLDQKLELSSQGSLMRINNESLIFTQANKFATSFSGGVLETGSFASELLSILMKEDDYMVYPGGINLTYGSETNTATPTARVHGNYFPLSSNQPNGLGGCPMNIYACTLGMLSQFGNSLPNGMVAIPIRREDCYNQNENNAWYVAHCENPVQVITTNVVLNIDNNNIYRSFANMTFMEGINQNHDACFVVVDSDSLTDDIPINIGNGLQVFTQANSPFLNVLAPLVVPQMDDITGITQNQPVLMNKAYYRWKKYYYNTVDIEVVMNVASLVLHKVPLVQAHTMIPGPGNNTIVRVMGVRDGDRANRTDLWTCVAETNYAGQLGLNIANSITCFVDPLLYKHNGDVKYQIGTTSLRVRLAAARHWLKNFGMQVINSESLSSLYYRTVIQANKLITISDMSRMLSGKPCNMELLNPLMTRNSNQTIQKYFRLFAPLLNRIISKKVGYEALIHGEDYSQVVLNSINSGVGLLDCGGLANLALFPGMFKHFTDFKDIDLDDGFDMEMDQVTQAITYTRTYDPTKILPYHVNKKVETIYDPLKIQPLYRFHNVVTTGINTTYYDGTNVLQSTTCHVVANGAQVIYRVWIRRGYNVTTTHVEIKKITIASNMYYLRSQLSESSFIKEMNKQQTNFKNLDNEIGFKENAMCEINF